MTNPIWTAHPGRREQMLDLSQKIRPVLRFAYILPNCLPFKYRTDDGALYYLKPFDPFAKTFLRQARPDGRARYLENLRTITTYHACESPESFRPSIAEVIAQIPQYCLNKTVAFEIVVRPETAADLSAQWDDITRGYHRATTRLYANRDLSMPWIVAREEPF